MGHRLLWILLAGLGIALLILIARHEQGMVGPLTTQDFSSLTYKIALLVFLGGTVFTLFRGHLAKALEAIFFWLAIALVLTLVYTYRIELRTVSDRVIAELVPGHAVMRAARTVEVARGNTGEFPVAVQVNGARIPMVLDTGASTVVLTHDDARAAGLPLEVLGYTVNIDTANGRTRAAPVTLDRIAIGSLTERSVQALIAQPGQLKVSLLGMSFLNRLQSWEVRGDRLVLHGYP